MPKKMFVFYFLEEKKKNRIYIPERKNSNLNFLSSFTSSKAVEKRPPILNWLPKKYTKTKLYFTGTISTRTIRIHGTYDITSTTFTRWLLCFTLITITTNTRRLCGSTLITTSSSTAWIVAMLLIAATFRAILKKQGKPNSFG